MQKGKKYSKYEKTRIIAARALQIAEGAPALIKITKKDIKPAEIAEMEFEKAVIPIEIKEKTEIQKKNQ